MTRSCIGVVGVLCAALLIADASGDVGQSEVDVPRFTSPVKLDVGANPLGVVAADLNADGKPDLATADWTSSTVSVLFGEGNGTFRDRIRYGTARRAAGITAGDLDGDGNLDLVSASADRTGSISVLLGRGSGRFDRADKYAAGSKAFGVAAGDVNRDGIVDLVTAHFDSRNLAVLLGTGAGRFRVAHRYGGGRATGVALGDLNGDGNLDVVLAVADNDTVAVRLGAGDGAFGPGQAYAAGSYPYRVTLADFNHDGKLDIAAANYVSADVAVFLGAGDGSFAAGSRHPMGDGSRDQTNVDAVLVADYDRDGNLDVATPEFAGPVVRRGRGDGSFDGRRAAAAGSTFVWGGAVADFNLDGWPDLAFSGACDEIEIDCDAVPTRSAYVFLNWTGRSKPPCVVPDVTGVAVGLRAAKRAIRLAGCQLGQVRSRHSRRARVKHRVISQHPPYGAVLPSQTRVDLVIRRGARP